MKSTLTALLAICLCWAAGCGGERIAKPRNGYSPIDEFERVKRRAESFGTADAQFNLGLKYHIGSGVPKDDKEAVKWYRKAAEQGHAKAQYNLGNMYYNGKGVPKDDKEAVKWYRKAAEQGDAVAQFFVSCQREEYCVRGSPQPRIVLQRV